MHPFRRLAELIEDWQYLIRLDGIKSALPIVALEIARLPYRHLMFHILARSLAEPLPEMQPKILLEIHPFEPSHLELVRAIDRPSEARLCAQRLERGQHGLIALYNDQAAGYAWVCSPVDWDLERVRLQLESGDILCTDVFTVPALRGKGVQTALTLARFRKFRDLGYQRAICYIEAHNFPSLAVWQRKFDAKTAGEVDFLRIGPWYRVRCSYSPTGQDPDASSALVQKPKSKLETLIGGSR